MKITITEYDGDNVAEITVSKRALDLVRASFNPAHDHDVMAIKFLAAALIEKCFQQQERGIADVPRCAAIAVTNFEQGAMWAVKAATHGL